MKFDLELKPHFFIAIASRVNNWESLSSSNMLACLHRYSLIKSVNFFLRRVLITCEIRLVGMFVWMETAFNVQSLFRYILVDSILLHNVSKMFSTSLSSSFNLRSVSTGIFSMRCKQSPVVN